MIKKTKNEGDLPVKWDCVIKNGTIVNSTDIYKANIYVKDEKIAAITNETIDGNALEEFDATGLYVLPGLIDTHVHSRDQGVPQKEDFYHSTQAAAAGGLTTIFEMPNAIPAIINTENLSKQINNLTPKAHVDFAIWGLCLGNLNMKEIKHLNKAGVVAFKYFWGYGIDSKTYQLIYNYDSNMKNVIHPLKDGEVYEIFKEVSKTGKIVAIHAENADLIQTLTKNARKSEEKSYEAFLESRPNLAEETIIQTAISFAKTSKAKLHILHMSTKEGVELVQQAQKQGLPITAETCPHFLFLSNENYNKIGPKMKVYPPVRYKIDQEKLWKGIQNKAISFICSDHAPHTENEKTGDIWTVPAGMCGTETLAPLMLDAVNKEKITINQFVLLLSENPAKVFGLYPEKGSLQIGTDADITIVDLKRKFTIKKENLHSKSKVTAFDNWEITGTPVATIVRGKPVMKNGEIVNKPIGKFIRPLIS